MFILEDTLHRQLWDALINIIKFFRENPRNTVSHHNKYAYCLLDNSITAFNSEKEYDEKDFIVFNETSELFVIKRIINKSLCTKADISDSMSDCFLCEYACKICENKNTVVPIFCRWCPVEVPIAINDKDCLGGLYNIAFSSTVQIGYYSLLSDFVFNSIITSCEKIRDIKFKEDVITRSSLSHEGA